MKEVVLSGNQERVVRRFLERLGETQHVDLVKEYGIHDVEGFIESLKRRTNVCLNPPRIRI